LSWILNISLSLVSCTFKSAIIFRFLFVVSKLNFFSSIGSVCINLVAEVLIIISGSLVISSDASFLFTESSDSFEIKESSFNNFDFSILLLSSLTLSSLSLSSLSLIDCSFLFKLCFLIKTSKLSTVFLYFNNSFSNLSISLVNSPTLVTLLILA